MGSWENTFIDINPKLIVTQTSSTFMVPSVTKMNMVKNERIRQTYGAKIISLETTAWKYMSMKLL